jgi:hypothetical protein
MRRGDADAAGEHGGGILLLRFQKPSNSVPALSPMAKFTIEGPLCEVLKSSDAISHAS